MTTNGDFDLTREELARLRRAVQRRRPVLTQQTEAATALLEERLQGAGAALLRRFTGGEPGIQRPELHPALREERRFPTGVVPPLRPEPSIPERRFPTGVITPETEPRGGPPGRQLLAQALTRPVTEVETLPAVAVERILRGLQLAFRPFEAAGAVVGAVASGDRERAAAVDRMIADVRGGRRSLRNALGELIGQFEELPVAEQMITTLPFMGLPVLTPGAAGVARTALGRAGARAGAAVERVAPRLRQALAEQRGAIGREPAGVPVTPAAALPRKLTKTEFVNMADMQRRLREGRLAQREIKTLERLEDRHQAWKQAAEGRQERRATLARGQAEMPVTPAAAPAAKEPWQMTRAEFVASARQWRAENMPRLQGRALEGELEGVSGTHPKIVEQALSEGKPVPAEVLAEYPDLAAAARPVTPAAAPVIRKGVAVPEAIKAASSRQAEAAAGPPGPLLEPPAAAQVPPSPIKPPVEPPAPPPGPAAGPPPVPPGITQTLDQARAIVTRDRPGTITRMIDLVPGPKQVQRMFLPYLGMSDDIRAAWIGEGSAIAQVESRLQQQTILGLNRLEGLFGKGAVMRRDFRPAGVAYRGTPAERAANATGDYTGTLADIVERPALYELSGAQRAAIAEFQQIRSVGLQNTKASFGLDIGEASVQEGGMHIAHADVSQSAIDVSGSIESALRRGRAKERFYPTMAERLQHDSTFRPETTVGRLLAADDQTLATMAGRRVFLEGAGGKTRLEAMEATHPALAARMSGLKRKLTSLRGSVVRLDERQATAIDDFLKSPLEDVDLTALQAELNPTIKRPWFIQKGVAGEPDIVRPMPPTKAFGKGIKTLRTEIAAVKAEIAELRPSWRVANLKPYTFVQEGVYRYFPADEAKQIRRLLQTSSNPFLRLVDQLRATAFGGDLSPVSIQGAVAWLSNPIGVSRHIASGKVNFTRTALIADMQANAESWALFTRATGINPLGGIGPEFAVGLPGKLPKVGKFWTEFNETLYRPITGYQKGGFDGSYRAGLKSGLTSEQAAAVAADDMTKLIPRYSFRRLGQSQAEAARYRAVMTSVSFLTQPVALMSDAAKGFVKVGLRQPVSRSEAFAMKRVLTLVVTTEAIAVTSAAIYAQTHNLDVKQHVLEALNPASGRFMSLTLPWGARVGLGGPFRSIIRAVWPRKVPGVPVPLPFAGIHRFAMSKLGPAPRVIYDEIRNVDFYGKRIRTGEFPMNILQMLEYAIEGVLPLTLGSALQQWRRGEGLGVVGQEAASQFMGTNYQPFDPVYAAKVRWADQFKAYQDLPTNAAEAKAKGVLSRQEYRTRNPEVDARLFLTNQVTSLQTAKAEELAVTLMLQNEIEMKHVTGLEPQEFDSAERKRRRQWFEKALREAAAEQAQAVAPTPTPTPSSPAPSSELSREDISRLLEQWRAGQPQPAGVP